MNKTEILSLFEPMQRCWLATYDGEYPRVRPMILTFCDNRFWLASGIEDAKTEQIKNHPNVAVSVSLRQDGEECYLRIKGKAHYSNAPEEREMVWNVAKYIAGYFDKPDHPGFGLIEVMPDTVHFMAPGSNIDEPIDWK